MNDDHLRWVEDWLSPERFARYKQASGGDTSAALALYEWNAEMSAAIKRDIDHVEVGLRNAYSRAIAARWSGANHWVHSADEVFPELIVTRKRGRQSWRSDFNQQSRSELQKAQRRAGGSRAQAGKVIAELPLGFWRSLTTKTIESSMWQPYVQSAFPRGTNRADIHTEVTVLNKLRNRTAHAEPVIGIDIQRAHRQILALTHKINPELASYIAATSRVESVELRRPGRAQPSTSYEQLTQRNRPPARRRPPDVSKPPPPGRESPGRHL